MRERRIDPLPLVCLVGRDGNTLQFECRSKSRAGLVHHQEFDADKLVMRCDCEWGSSPDAYPRFKEHSLDLLVADQCQPCWHLRSLHRHVLPYLRSLDIL